MVIPLESRAHVIFKYEYNLVPGQGLCREKLYYEGIRIKVPKKYGLMSVAKLLSKSTDSTEIEILELKKINCFTKDKNKALTFRHDEVKKNAEQLILQESEMMYVESLNKEWTPF